MLTVEKEDRIKEKSPKPSYFDDSAYNTQQSSDNRMQFAQENFQQQTATPPVIPPVTSEQELQDPKILQGSGLVQEESQQQQPPLQKTPQDIINELMSFRQPKPVFDEKRPEDLQRLARQNAVAKGLGLVGDVVSLAKNANVNRRQPDNKEAMYTNQIYKYLDDYTNKVNQWNYMDFANKLRGKQTELQQANADRAFEENQKQTGIMNEIRQDQIKRQNTYTDAQIENMKSDNERQNKVADAQIKNYESLATDRQNKISNKAAADAAKKNVKIQTQSGKVYELTPEQASAVRNIARQNMPELIKKYPHLFEQAVDKDGDPIKGKYIISKGATDEDLIRAAIEMQESSENAQKAGEYIQGYMNKADNTQPQQTETKNDSTNIDINQWKRKK